MPLTPARCPESAPEQPTGKRATVTPPHTREQTDPIETVHGALDAVAASAHKGVVAHVASALAREGARLLGAATAVVALPVEDGESLECQGVYGRDEAAPRAWRRFRRNLPLPLADAFNSRCVTLHDTRSPEFQARYPLVRESLEALGTRALLVFSLQAGDEVLAVASFGFEGKPRAGAAWDRRVADLRRTAAQALDRARLVQEARRAQSDAAAARTALRQQRQFYEALQASQSESERALRDAQRRLTFHVTNSPLAAIEWDRDGRITFWSPGAERLFGWSAAEALDVSGLALGLIRPEDEEHVRAVTKRLYQGEDRNVSLNRNYTRGDDLRVCRWYNSALRDDDGVLVSVLSLVQDVTDQTQTEQALRDSETRFRRLVETAHEGICVLRSDGAIEYANPRLAEMLGLTPGELRGRSLDTFVTVPETGVVIDIELRGRYGARRWAMFSKSEITTETGRVIGVLATFADITERKHAEAEREMVLAENARLLARVQESAAFQRTFLRDMLASVTDGRLRLCNSEKDLPPPLTPLEETDPIPLQAETLRAMRQRLRETSATVDLPENRASDLLLGAGEAAMNAVVHAGGGVAHLCADPSQNALQVWVRDSGAGIALDHLHRATLEPGFSSAGTLGHGFFLMLSTCDLVYLHTGPEGTTVVLEQAERPRGTRGLPARVPL